MNSDKQIENGLLEMMAKNPDKFEQLICKATKIYKDKSNRESSGRHRNSQSLDKEKSKEYFNSLTMVQQWIENCLDEIRIYIKPIEYPLFVHLYLDMINKNGWNEAKNFIEKFESNYIAFSSEINILKKIQPPIDKTDELYMKYMKNKIHIFIPETVWSFFIQFLDTNHLINILEILNNFFERSSILSKLDVQQNSCQFLHLCHSSEEIEKINSRTQIYYNKPTKEEMENANKKLRNRSDDKNALAKVLIPYPDNYYDFPPIDSSCLKIDKNNPPSIGCFTVLNCNNKLNCADLSKDGGIIACGFKDGCVMVWVIDNEIPIEITENNIKELEQYKDNYLPKFLEKSDVINKSVKDNTENKDNNNPSDNTADNNGLFNQNGNVFRINSDIDNNNNNKNIANNSQSNNNNKNSPEFHIKLDESNKNFVYNLITNRHKSIIFYGHTESVYSVSIEPTLSNIISGSYDGTIRLWNLHTKTCIGIYRGHYSPVLSVKFSPLSHYFASGSSDKTARLWSINSVCNLRIFVGHLSDVEMVDFHPNGFYLLTVACDRTIRMWTLKTGECARIFVNYCDSPYVDSFGFSNSGKLLVISVNTGIIIYDLVKMGDPVSIVKNLTQKSITSIAFDNDDNVIVVTTIDYKVYFYDLESILNSEDNLQIDNQKDKIVELIYNYTTKKTTILNITFTKTNLMLMLGRFDDNDPKIFI